MNAISSISAVSLAKPLEAATHLTSSLAPPPLDDHSHGGTTWSRDCGSREGHGEASRGNDEGNGPEIAERRLPDLLPGDSDVLWPKDREIYVDDNGKLATRVVVRGTSGDDDIHVVYNADGSADVTVNGESTHYSPEQARNMRVDAGAGDDTITIDDNRQGGGSGEPGNLRVDGGSGDDHVVVNDNTRFGGGGNVTVNGGSGDDQVEVNNNSRFGGGDRITVNGDSGNDTVTVKDHSFFTAGGRIEVNGGSGDDQINGDLNGVHVHGGSGHDTVNGWPKDDVPFSFRPQFLTL